MLLLLVLLLLLLRLRQLETRLGLKRGRLCGAPRHAVVLGGP